MSFSPSTQALRLTAAVAHHQGDKTEQQDRASLLRHPYRPDIMLGLVADGVGGLSGGRLAADQVAMTASQLFERFDPRIDTPAGLLAQIALEAHLAIRLSAAMSRQRPHSTLAAFMLMPDRRCHWVHFGDSRIYHLRDGRVLHHTADHAVIPTQNERQRMILALGSEIQPNPAHHVTPPLQSGDLVLACTDGVWSQLAAWELAASAAQPEEAGEWLQRLLATARSNSRGHSDNQAAVMIRLETGALPR